MIYIWKLKMTKNPELKKIVDAYEVLNMAHTALMMEVLEYIENHPGEKTNSLGQVISAQVDLTNVVKFQKKKEKL